jgi:hypothetical protein
VSGAGKQNANAELNKIMTQVLRASNRAAQASLAGAIIAASGRPHSINEALAVLRSVSFAMSPAPDNPAYEAWAKDKDKHLSKVYN